MSKKILEKPAQKVQVPAEDITVFVRDGFGKDTQVSEIEPLEPELIEAVIRLTADVPKSDHARFKAACAMKGVTMSEEICSFIKCRVAELESDIGTTYTH